MPSTVPFKDLSLSFAKNKVTDDLLVKKEDAAVKQAVLNLLLTNKGERVYDSDYGSNIRTYLFEPLDYGTSQQIVGGIQTAIEKYEPRIGIRDLSAKPNRVDNGYDVEMTYVIRGTDLPPVAVEFFLERTR